jgi:hypothetical protein
VETIKIKCVIQLISWSHSEAIYGEMLRQSSIFLFSLVHIGAIYEELSNLSVEYIYYLCPIMEMSMEIC